MAGTGLWYVTVLERLVRSMLVVVFTYLFCMVGEVSSTAGLGVEGSAVDDSYIAHCAQGVFKESLRDL